MQSIPKSLCAETPTDLLPSGNGQLTALDSTWGCLHLSLPGLADTCLLAAAVYLSRGPGSRAATAQRGRGQGIGTARIRRRLYTAPRARTHTPAETEAGRQQPGSRCRAARGRARTRTTGRVPPRGRSSAAEARPGSHRRSFTKKVSRPAPLTHSPEAAPAVTRAPAAYGSVPGSTPGWARAPAAATAPSPRGPGRVRLELTVPPARRARRPRAPCSRRAARLRDDPHNPPTPNTAHARIAAHAPRAPPRVPPTAQARTRRAPPRAPRLAPSAAGRCSQRCAHPLCSRPAGPESSPFWAGRRHLPHCGRRRTRPLSTAPFEMVQAKRELSQEVPGEDAAKVMRAPSRRCVST